MTTVFTPCRTEHYIHWAVLSFCYESILDVTVLLQLSLTMFKFSKKKRTLYTLDGHAHIISHNILNTTYPYVCMFCLFCMLVRVRSPHANFSKTHIYGYRNFLFVDLFHMQHPYWILQLSDDLDVCYYCYLLIEGAGITFIWDIMKRKNSLKVLKDHHTPASAHIHTYIATPRFLLTSYFSTPLMRSPSTDT